MRAGSRSLLSSALVIAAFAAVSPAHAAKALIGGKGGWINADLAGSNDGGIGTKNSGLLGVIFGWEFNSWFAVHVEPDITQKGATLEDYSFGDLPTTVKLTYVELPVLAKFKHVMSSEGQGGIFGTAGLSLGVSTHAQAYFAGSDTNFNQQVQGVDFGIAFGGGYDIPSGPGLTTIEARYIVGLTDVFESTAPRQEVTGDLKNRALEVTIGWFRPFQ